MESLINSLGVPAVKSGSDLGVELRVVRKDLLHDERSIPLFVVPAIRKITNEL